MKVIARSQIIEVLTVATANGATFITLVTETDARLKKTGNSFGQVNKLSRVNIACNTDYEAGVQRQQVREGAAEGTFKAQAHKWAEHVPGCRWLVRHPETGELYVVGKPERALEDPTYIKAISREVLDYEAVKSFLPAKRSNAEAQGVEKEIPYRQWKLESIKEIHCNNERYVIVPEAAAVEAVTHPAPVENENVVIGAATPEPAQ
jgi:hypothetical protein